jgi:hypothetical protein
MPIIPSTSVEIQDEATTQGYVKTIDFAGAGVTAAVAGGKATVTIPGGGGPGGSAWTLFTQNLGAAMRDGTFTITSTGLTAGKPVEVIQRADAIATKGNATDEPEMDLIQLTGNVVDATTIRVYWKAPSVVVGTYNFAYLIGA